MILFNTEYDLNLNGKFIILRKPLKARSVSFIAYHIKKLVLLPSALSLLLLLLLLLLLIIIMIYLPLT